jgi:phosphohistidine phosphatase
MELILWRHADAEDPGPQGDAGRRLTRKGEKQAERMARWLRPQLKGTWRVVSSPAVRALETVAPLDLPYEVRETVSSAASPEQILEEAGWPGAGQVVVVGHQPTLGQVAAILLGGQSGEVSVRKGAILWFSTRNRDDGEETVLKAVLDPDTLERMEKGAK